MKTTRVRWLIRFFHVVLLFLCFAAGFAAACKWMVFTSTTHLEKLDETRRKLCQTIYGSNYLHVTGIDKEADAKLEAFDPAQGCNGITMTYDSVWGHHELTLEGNGDLISETKKGRRTLTRLEPGRCKEMFRKFLTSGLLNFSDGLLELKMDLDEELTPQRSISRICDASDLTLRIKATDLEIDKEISVYAPEFELEKNHPDIVEFKQIVEIEQEMMKLVPEGEKDWWR